jgi:hypothetical protein
VQAVEEMKVLGGDHPPTLPSVEDLTSVHQVKSNMVTRTR